MKSVKFTVDTPTSERPNPTNHSCSGQVPEMTDCHIISSLWDRDQTTLRIYLRFLTVQPSLTSPLCKCGTRMNPAPSALCDDITKKYL